jgi:uncharacterized cofD-like protein
MNIVTLGGGTGQYHILRALRLLKARVPEYTKKITAIPTTSDSGGSSGVLRFDYHIVAPGDISQCVLGLHPKPEEGAWLFGHRFTGGMLHGHTTRNIIVATALQKFGPSQMALDAIRDTFCLDGDIAPATFSETQVHILLKNGTVLTCEDEIYHADMVSAGGVDRIWLEPSVVPNPRALQAIRKADIIIVCPGSLYCSIIPNLLVDGIAKALCESSAMKVYVANLMNQRGHVPIGWTAFDHVRCISNYLQQDFFDTVIVNAQTPNERQVMLYEPEKEYVSNMFGPDDEGYAIIAGNLLMNVPKQKKNDTSDTLAHLRASVRHDPERLSFAFERAFARQHTYA